MSPSTATVVELARSLSARCGQTAVIAVDGRAGSGKTTLASAVAGALAAPMVSMDSLYPGWDGLAEGIALLESEVLQPLSRGEEASVPVYDWHRGDWGLARLLTPPAILVVEGVGCGARSSSTHLSALVWLECDEAVRHSRALSRAADGAAFAVEWERWAAQEESLLKLDPIFLRADLVVRTDDSDAPTTTLAGHDVR
ncbi:unannotated protein [freshwater metagenome]|uniref:Unannotated protein n=1 Tax=freshwater metagenome TaxID=449393 RepID=A0A6J7J4W0_9ZZZZ